MKNLNLKACKGIGLIEVLITTVVIAVGLLAVMSLQTRLMSGSGENKARSEALALAEEKMEEFRNNMELGGTLVEAAGDTTKIDYEDMCEGANTALTGYYGVCSDATEADIVGVNATFQRRWIVTPEEAHLVGAPGRKDISVQVGWDEDGDGVVAGSDDERVVLAGKIAWINPVKSAILASTGAGAGTGSVPSPRQNASEDVDAASEKVVGIDMSITGTPGVDTTITASAPRPGGGTNVPIIIYQVGPGSHYYTALRDTGNIVLNEIDPGVIAVFLCETTTCTHIQNHFGGVVLRHQGTVYSSSPVTTTAGVTSGGLIGINVAWTSSDVNACYNSPISSFSGVVDGVTKTIYTQTYECPFAGNCNATLDGDRTRTSTGNVADSTNFDESCYVNTSAGVTNAQINARNVGPGGEFGDVGLLGVKASQGNREEVCFLEDTALSTSVIIDTAGAHKTLNENYLFIVSKRFYVSRRIRHDGTINKQSSEGINRSYSNHNFLVIDRVSNNKTGGACDDIAIDNNLAIATRNIARVFNENIDNNTASPDKYIGIAGRPIVVTGNIATGQGTDLRAYIEEIGACYVKADGSDYACVVPKGNVTEIITDIDSDGEANTDGDVIKVTDFVTGTIEERTINSFSADGYDVTNSTSITITVKGGSEERPAAATPQSFSACDILPAATCNWTGTGFGNIAI